MPDDALALNFSRALIEFVAQRVLHAQIERELHRPLQPVGGEPGHVQRGEPLPVQPLLDAGDALVVDIDEADVVRHDRAVGIDTLVLGEEADAGNAEPVNFLLLLRRDLALEPDEAAFGREPVAQFGGVEIGQHRSEQFLRLVDIDELARLGKQRRRFDVGRENAAVAVEDIRAARSRPRPGRRCGARRGRR